MGKWKNPPVVYVIVQVRFSPVVSLDLYIPAIQEHFRLNGFPAFARRLNFQIGAVLPPPPSDPQDISPAAIPMERMVAYVFSNREQNQSFVLDQNGLTFSVTDYEDFSWFLALFLQHLKKITEVVKLDSSERIGLRYVDAVLPKQGSSAHDYLVPELHGLSKHLPAGVPQHTYSETLMIDGDTSTMSRVMVREGQIALPPDMISFPVKIQPRFLEYRGSHAVIDTDSFQAGFAAMDITRVEKTITHLHDHVGRAFKAVVADVALTDWR
jgi:uncharacterized protein (TIGR04255 family)